MASPLRDSSTFARKLITGRPARFAVVFSSLLVLAFVALAAPQDRDRDRDHDRDRDDRDAVPIRISYDRIAVDFGGGHGGRPSEDALCPPDWVAVGFHVQTGEYFNEMWLECAPIRRGGRIGDERQMTHRTGSPGGRPVHDAYCPPGRALRGIRGRTGASVDEAAGECSFVREIYEHRPEVHTDLTEPVYRPNAGGHPSEAQCPPGFVLTGLRSNSGEYMDHLWALCSDTYHEH